MNRFLSQLNRLLKKKLKFFLGSESYSNKRDYFLSRINKSKRMYRLATYKLRPKPDFIIPGAMKSGTTSMFYYLSRYEKVRPPFRKEIHFFDHNYDEGESWYRSNFPISANVKNGLITGESSPYYLFYPRAPKRIKRVTPEAKIIVLLRDPAERAISHYWHNVRVGTENLNILDAFKEESERISGEEEKIKEDGSYYGYNHVKFSYLERGKYHYQLDRYFRKFERSDVMILKSSSFFESTSESMKKVCNFLGLKYKNREVYRKTNEGEYLKGTPKEVKYWLKTYFEEPNRKLSDKYGVSFE